MLRAYNIFRTASTKPVEAIESVIAVVMTAIGLYVVSPFFAVSASSPIAQSFETGVQHVLVGLIFFIIPSLPIILSFFFKKFHTKRYRAMGTFMMSVALIFAALLTILTIGLVPVSWIYTLGMSIISGICYLYVKQSK